MRRLGVEGSVSGVHIESVGVEETWARLKSDPGSVLIDVRTIAEWAYVGLPELTSIGKRPVLVEWQGFPDDRLNAAFVDRITEALGPLGANRDSELFFICFLYAGPAAAASRRPGPWRRPAMGVAATLRKGSKGHSIPTVIGDASRVGRHAGFHGRKDRTKQRKTESKSACETGVVLGCEADRRNVGAA
jgi:hypothetical protein